MGMITIWDGEQLPPIGCDVLIELASQSEPYRMRVTGYYSKKTSTPHHKIIAIDLVDLKNCSHTNQRLLDEVHPLTWRKEP